jgi:hypothetical protein
MNSCSRTAAFIFSKTPTFSGAFGSSSLATSAFVGGVFTASFSMSAPRTFLKLPSFSLSF